MEFVHDIPIPDSMDTYLGIDVDLVTLEDCEDLHRFKNKNGFKRKRKQYDNDYYCS